MWSELCQGSHDPRNHATSMHDPHWDRADRGKKKVLHLCMWGHIFATLQGFTVCGDSPGNTTGVGCHTLLEHYISYCPSHQPIWCCQAPATQEVVPPPHLVLTRADTSLPWQPSGANPCGQHTCRGGDKTTIETQSCEIQNLYTEIICIPRYQQ